MQDYDTEVPATGRELAVCPLDPEYDPDLHDYTSEGDLYTPIVEALDE
jgi:hypothetical protein